MFHFDICIRLIFGNSKNSLSLKQFRIYAKISSTDIQNSYKEEAIGIFE